MGEIETAVHEPKSKLARPRLTSLDGLRGLVALDVLIHRALLTLASPYYAGTASLGRPAWFATCTPLHILWAGTEAVYLFFVLSGIGLTIPLLRIDNFSWAAYFPKLIVRLYIPVLAAVRLGALTVVAVPRVNALELGP